MKNASVKGRCLLYQAKRREIASKGRFKIHKINKFIITIEGSYEKHIINTYLKTNKPLMWWKFFINIAWNRDYLYNFCNNPFNRFQKHCYEWYQYKLLENNTGIYYEDVEQNNLMQLQFFLN